MATIVIVDDGRVNREYLSLVLEPNGYRLLHASNGEEALEVIRRERPDLVISDILMPTMDGYELLRQLRSDPAVMNTPVIFYTAHYNDEEARSLARAWGVADVMSKGCEPELILQSVQAALNRESAATLPTPAAEDFERAHRRLLTDKLSRKVENLRAANERLRASEEANAKYIERLRILHQIDRALIAGEGPAEIAAAALVPLRQLLGVARAIVNLFSLATDEVEWLAAAGRRRVHVGPGVRYSIRFMGDVEALRRGEPQVIDVDSLPPGPELDALLASGVHAYVVVPMIAGGELIGALSFGGGAVPLTTEQLDIAQEAAAQFALALAHARLNERLKCQAQELEVRLTERKQAEEAQRAAQQRLQHVVSSSPAVLFTLAVEDDRIRGISWMSHNVCEMLGYSESETHGADWWMGHVHPDEVQSTIATVHQDLFSREFTTHEYRFQHQDGSYRWIRSEIRLLRDASGKPTEAVGSWSDITERKQLEEQYRQAQKMEAVGRLAGGVAHDFNNLLTVIMGYSEIYLQKLRPEDPLRIALTQIHKAGERATGLTRQLLAFSRKQVLMPVVLDLNSIIADMEKMLRRLIGEDVFLTVLAGTDLWKVKADPGQMEQVVMNIMVNARDAMPQGGKLLMETRNVELDNGYVHSHPEAKTGEYVLLAITDNGCGMDAAVKARIFEPFFTTKGPNKGTGLGLATVFGIVKQSGGHIEVYTELGQGTTFKIYLPRDTSGVPIEVPSRVLEPVRDGTEIILLVEDEEGVRNLARTVLQQHGYTVLDAMNGGDALMICEIHSQPIDLMITDVVMPHFSGRQLAERLAMLQPTMKVLYMSGYTDDAIVYHGVLESGMPFLQKPFAPDALVRKVREVLDSNPDQKGGNVPEN